MRWFSRNLLLVLAGIALLVSVAGCSPGPVVWKADGNACPVSPLRQEAMP